MESPMVRYQPIYAQSKITATLIRDATQIHILIELVMTGIC